jgi:tetraprenyl-beta-curcumene synthase
MPRGTADLIPFDHAQARALAAAVVRELSWGLHAAACELRGWRRRALAIPDARLREDALRSLDGKRGHAHGAALFTILPRRREPRLLRLLVAYGTLVDYLDEVSERHPEQANGAQLHQAPIDALEPARPCADWYRRHPWREDAGYLAALVETCRAGCRELPSFERVRAPLLAAAHRGIVLGLNHDSDPRRRDAALRAWAEPQLRTLPELSWFEASGAASATLVMHVLLTLAVEEQLAEHVVEEVNAVYWPWVSLVTTMLDSYVDQADDAARGEHSYISHYAGLDTAVPRLREAIARALETAGALPDGERHVVIVGCMVALFLSKRSARTPELSEGTRELVAGGGTLVRALLPVLRGWRVAYGQRLV